MHAQSKSSSMKEVEDAHPDSTTSSADFIDGHDPLNWSTSRKLLILAIVGVWIFLGTANMIIIGPALGVVTEEFQSSPSASTYLIGGPLLAYGVFSFIWVPVGNRFGVRAVFVITAVVAGCMSCWGAKASSFGALVAARTLASGFFAPPETLAPQMVGDVFHPKDRSKAMSIVGILQATGFAGGPLIGGYIVQNPYVRLMVMLRLMLNIVTEASAGDGSSGSWQSSHLLPQLDYLHCSQRRNIAAKMNSLSANVTGSTIIGFGPSVAEAHPKCTGKLLFPIAPRIF
jgi:MFS family permease